MKCPWCAEEIKDEAVVCRYCGKDAHAKVRRDQPAIASEIQDALWGSRPPADLETAQRESDEALEKGGNYATGCATVIGLLVGLPILISVISKCGKF